MEGRAGRESKAMRFEGSRREWKTDLPQQLEKVGAAHNLLRQVSFEAEELLRLQRGTPEEKDYLGFKQDIDNAMSLLVEARRRLLAYCG